MKETKKTNSKNDTEKLNKSTAKKDNVANKKVEPEQVETEIQESNDFSFIEEKIKERPINKKKLVRKMILTAGAAIIFGAVACVTFLFLEPLFSKVIAPATETPLQQVTISEVSDDLSEELPDVTIEETPLEDMNLIDDDPEDGIVLTDEEIAALQNATGEPVTIVETVPLELNDYQTLYRKMYALANEVQKSVVTVTGMTSDVDWMNTTYQLKSQTTGLIIGDNGQELLILADSKNIRNAGILKVTFCDGDMVNADLKRMDEVTGLAIYGVRLNQIPSVTKDAYAIATIGTSYSAGLMGGAVIAVGNPTGISNSVCYGAVTSNTLMVSVPDANYQILTTDIFGSQNSSGVLINMRGQVIGFINQDHNSDEMKNMVYAYGISSIRKLIENLSNDVETTYMGVYLTDVVEPAKSEYGIPQGAYITKVDLNSPAMNVGISSGDIIVGVEDRVIVGVSDYVAIMSELEPDQMINVRLMRLSGDSYKEYDVDVRLSSR